MLRFGASVFVQRDSVVFFFLEHAGELRIFVLREEKECSNYKSQHPTLDQSEGCSGLIGTILQKKKTHCRQQALLLH